MTCSIDINDFGGSGVNGSSVKYYYKISGYAKFEGPYSAAIENYGESITATTPIPLQLDNGDDNAIKWIVDDMAGNVMASEEFVIRVDDQRKPNTPPDPPTGIKPTDTKDSTPMITWSAGNDKEGDTLEFSIQIGTYYDGDDILSWTNVGTNTQYLVPENNSLVVGTYYVQLRAFDSLDYSAVYQSMMNITATGNSPPSAPNAIYSNVTSEHRPEITWTGASDPDGDPLRYRIQIGTRPGIDDILSHSDIGNEILLKESYTPNSALEDGIYYIQIIALDGFSGSSAPHEEMLKIASFRPEITVQNTLTIKKGETLATFEINLKNNCSMHDNITLSLSGELTTKSSVTLTFKPTAAPILVDPYKTEKINLKIEVPEEMSVGSYKVVIQATSEDGLTTSFEHELTLIVTSDGKPTDGNDGGGDGDDDGSTSGFGAMFPIIIIIIIIVIVVVIIGVVAASASKKKREKAEKDKFFNSSNDYEKLYGPKKEY